jgi:hypothetical protein
MAVKIRASFVRKSFLDTPTGHNRAAALFAIGDKGRLWLHRKRHTVHAVVDGGVTAVNAKGSIDPQVWVELDLVQYIANDAIVGVDGTVYRAGRMTTPDFEEGDVAGEIVQRELPECHRVKNGWSL